MFRKSEVYQKVKDFKKRHGLTICWRLRAHCKVAEEHINKDEEILYAFAGQKGNSPLDFFTTFVVVVTEQRIVLAQKRLLFGYFYYSITPDLFNDLTIKMGLIWGRVIIDTVKETVTLTYVSKDALGEIETAISKYMIQKKRMFESDLTPEEEEKLEKELIDLSKHGEK